MLVSLLLTSFIVGSCGFHLNKLSSLQRGRHLLMTARDAATQKSAKKSQKPQKPKPVILLDVDGIINFRNDRLEKLGMSSVEYEAMSLKYAQSVWEDVRIDAKGRVNMMYSPTVVSKINAWGKHAEIRWLTSWGARAPEELAPLMGINAFPCLPYDNSAHHPPKAVYAQQVADEVGPDRLIIWLDDDVSYFLPRRCDARRKGEFVQPYTMRKFYNGDWVDSHTLSTSGNEVELRPNTLYVGPWCGLAPKHLDLVDKHLADPSLAAGKAIYELDGGHFERAYTEGELLKEGERLDLYRTSVFSDFSNTVAFPL